MDLIFIDFLKVYKNQSKLRHFNSILSRYIVKGAHRNINQPVPLWGFETFCYKAPKMCSYFRGGAEKQPVPWHGGTG